MFPKKKQNRFQLSYKEKRGYLPPYGKVLMEDLGKEPEVICINLQSSTLSTKKTSTIGVGMKTVKIDDVHYQMLVDVGKRWKMNLTHS